MFNLFISFMQKLMIIIAFMYILLKLKQHILKRSSLLYSYVASILFSLISVLYTYQPIGQNLNTVNLQGIPIFCIAYGFGWYPSIIVLFLPILYRMHIGGDMLYIDMIQGMIIPWLIGVMFHLKDVTISKSNILNMKQMFIAFTFFEFLRMGILYSSYHTYPLHLCLTILFDACAVFCVFLMVNDNTKSALRKKELEYHSNYDNLTQLYNLRYFKKNVDLLDKNKESYVIAMFDVDFFKKFNDSYGHLAGDEVLRTIGQLLHDSMREEDIFARYGGEEFIICFNGVSNLKTAVLIAERFRSNVANFQFPVEENNHINTLTVSIGLSGVSTGKNLDDLIAQADKMLYKAKHAGRNTIAF